MNKTDFCPQCVVDFVHTEGPAHLAREIESAVIRDSMRWNCSKSWIIATALAAFYDIDIMLPYVIKKKKKAA